MAKGLALSQKTAANLKELIRGKNDSEVSDSTGTASATSVSDNRVCLVQMSSNSFAYAGGMYYYYAQVFLFEQDLSPISQGDCYVVNVNNRLINSEYYLACQVGSIPDPAPMSPLVVGRSVFMVGSRWGTISVHGTWYGQTPDIWADAPLNFYEDGITNHIMIGLVGGITGTFP